MKLKTLLLIVCFVTLKTSLFSQKISLGDIDQQVAVLKEGKESFEKIEKMNSNIGARFVYIKDEDVQIITVTAKGKIEKQVEWFYKKGILLYTETNWSDSASLKPLFKEKTYHNNGTMIAWLDNENSFVDSSSPKFKKLEKELNTYAIKIRDEALE